MFTFITKSLQPKSNVYNQNATLLRVEGAEYDLGPNFHEISERKNAFYKFVKISKLNVEKTNQTNRVKVSGERTVLTIRNGKRNQSTSIVETFINIT